MYADTHMGRTHNQSPVLIEVRLNETKRKSNILYENKSITNMTATLVATHAQVDSAEADQIH